MSLRGTTLLGRRMSCPAYPLFSPSRGADGSPTCARVDAWRFQFAAGGVNSGRQPWRDLSAGGPHLLSAGDATTKPLRHCLGWNISTATGFTPCSQVQSTRICRSSPVKLHEAESLSSGRVNDDPAAFMRRVCSAALSAARSRVLSLDRRRLIEAPNPSASLAPICLPRSSALSLVASVNFVADITDIPIA